jgi:hypothetical protein
MKSENQFMNTLVDNIYFYVAPTSLIRDRFVFDGEMNVINNLNPFVDVTTKPSIQWVLSLTALHCRPTVRLNNNCYDYLTVPRTFYCLFQRQNRVESLPTLLQSLSILNWHLFNKYFGTKLNKKVIL